MTANGWFQILLVLGVTLAVTKPLGIFMTRVFNREKTFLDPVLRPIEKLVYRLTGVDEFFDRAQDRVQKRFFPIEYPRHEYAERLGDRESHTKHKKDLEPAICRHVRTSPVLAEPPASTRTKARR